MDAWTLPPIGPAECLWMLRRFRGLSPSTLASQARLHPDRLAFLEGALDAPTAPELQQLWVSLSTEDTRRP